MTGFQINPKLQMIIMIAVAIIYNLANGTIPLPLGVPDGANLYIASWAKWMIGIYVTILPFFPAFSSSLPGPLAPPDPAPVKAATKLANLPADANPMTVQGAKAEVVRALDVHTQP